MFRREGLLSFSLSLRPSLTFLNSGRSILFVTSAFLRFCGLPGATAQEVYSSPLVHMDILDLVTADTKAAMRDLRTIFNSAIRDGRSLSVSCGIRVRVRSFLYVLRLVNAKRSTDAVLWQWEA